MNKTLVNAEKKKFTNLETKSIVGSVLLGLVFVLVQQVTHRIDALIAPGSTIVGGVTWALFTGLTVLLFKQPAGIITAEVQALVSVATALSPLSIFFIPANGLASLSYSLVAWKLPMDKWSHHILAQTAANVVGNIIVAIGLYVILKLPIQIIVISISITTIAGIIGGSILTKKIYENIIKSKVLN